MSRVAELPSRSPFSATGDAVGEQRHLPLLSSSLRSGDSDRADGMDVTPSVSAAPTQNSHDGEPNGSSDGANASQSQTLGAATAAQQPKVVQTAFIHKLYKYVFLLPLSVFSCDPDTNACLAQYARRSEHSTSHLLV